MKPSLKGFTLIELIIVVIIIGILASIAAPMMQGMKAKAIYSEAVTTLGTIRTVMRLYYVEHEMYPYSMTTLFLSNYSDSNFEASLPGLTKKDLTGTYFGVECYLLTPPTPPKFGGTPPTICCYPDATSNTANNGKTNSAIRAAEAIACLDDPPNGCISMRVEDGHVYQSGISRSGYPDH